MSSNNVPKHLVIIPDGNRRWAKEKGLPSFEGHRRGFNIMKDVAKKARDLGIKILTVWAFSNENWNRTKEEIECLMDIYESWVDMHLEEALKDEVRIIHLGNKTKIRKSLLEKLNNAENKTKHFDKFYLCIALDYGGREEIIRVFNSIKSTKNISEKSFESHLDTKDIPFPNPDFVIRTSGEQRSSGFMIWQSAYSEYMFVKKYFPDFTVNDLEECIKEYEKRKRRFGA
ncbi:MAG: polyprenyl diphosphate synthase [bacterium]